MQTPDVTGAAGPTIAETLAKLGADPNAGLPDAEVQKRLKNYGPTGDRVHTQRRQAVRFKAH